MILVKNVTIIDEASKWHEKTVDIIINKGKIESIGKSLKAGKAEIIKGKKLCISPSWIDIGAQLNDPGLEHRETITEMANCAKIGGFATLIPFPNSQPAVDNKSTLEYVINAGKANNITILPMATISQGAKGSDLSELIDLHKAGAIAFTDNKKGVQDSGLLLRALQYVKSFKGLIINTPYDSNLGHRGLIHEGTMSTTLGTRGIPSMAEFTMTNQQLSILDYTESKLCLFGISTKETVDLIKSQNKKVNKISAIVPYLNLIFTDKDLDGFDSNLKVFPPLRSMDDQKALVKGLIDGNIAAISSNHSPLDPECKDLEFEYADFGASGLETVFSALNTHCTKLPLSVLIKSLTYGPAAILGIKQNEIAEGNQASVTIFDTEEEWKYNTSASPSKNNPFLGKTLKGKVVKVIK